MPLDLQTNRILDLCNAALAVPPTERMVFLADACAGDFRLRAGVESVLVALKDAHEFVTASSFEGDDCSACVDDIVGDCQLLEGLGEDALGTTFKARHLHDSGTPERFVRVLRGHLLARELISGFIDDVASLRRVDHPYLARLLDGGTTDDGAPYLVYEWVDGVRIDDWCDRERLDVAQRLDLVRCVCKGVHVAHQHLVAPCGINPAAIRVTPSGIPRLYDFASAGLLAAHGSRAAASTATFLRMGVADYVAPELLLEARVMTAADIYALGVLIFRLVTGMAPYQLDNRHSADIADTLQEAATITPSAMVSANSDWALATAIAHRRGVTPQRLARQLRGPVDALVQQAMAFDARQRHESAAALVQDISTWLDGTAPAGAALASGGGARRTARRVGLVALLGVTIVATVAAVHGFVLTPP